MAWAGAHLPNLGRKLFGAPVPLSAPDLHYHPIDLAWNHDQDSELPPQSTPERAEEP
jgi:hypothetical protein